MCVEAAAAMWMKIRFSEPSHFLGKILLELSYADAPDSRAAVNVELVYLCMEVKYTQSIVGYKNIILGYKRYY